jgi:hypothetical protein
MAVSRSKIRKKCTADFRFISVKIWVNKKHLQQTFWQRQVLAVLISDVFILYLMTTLLLTEIFPL